MAVNVPMTGPDDQRYPMPFPQEVALLARDKFSLSFADANRSVKKVSGRLFMSSTRMVFQVSHRDRAKAGYDTFEMPFKGIWDEQLVQPIFGGTHLSATLMYYDEQPFAGKLTFKLWPADGEVSAFLGPFNNSLKAARIQLKREQEGGTRPSSAPGSSATAPPPPEYYGNEAFVDPQYPNHIYTTEPVAPEHRDNAPAWHVSGDGMRRRNA